MKVKLEDIKKINALTLLVVGFTIGAIAMSLYYQPKFLSQQQTMTDISNKPTPTPFQYDVSKAINAGSSYYDVMKDIEKNEATHSSVQVVNVPDVAPTPIVEYKTQYQTAPAAPRGVVNYHTSNDGRYMYGSDGSFCWTSGNQIFCQ